MADATNLTRLDELINEISSPAESECELLREHLETARTYLQGAMPDEYLLSLRLANETLNCISDERRRTRAGELIDRLMAG